MTMLTIAPKPLAAACAADLLEVMPIVMAELRTAMRRHLGGALSVPQFRCLRYVADHDGASISDLAAFMGVTVATTSAMVERLVRAGFVASSTSRTDRRRTALSVTAQGRGLMGRIRRDAQAEFAATLASAAPAELQALRSAMAVLKGRFGQRESIEAVPA
jgi:DNA-binding MarR family transcriptional regulator